MKLLIYSMESTGASTFCYFLGQRPDSVAIIDVWSACLTPRLPLAAPIVAKATTTAIYWVTDHQKNFEPDRTILFIRDPVAVHASLIKYHYANEYGSVEEKLQRLDYEYENYKFDLVVRYEDFILKDSNLLASINDVGWPVYQDYFLLRRPLQEIGEFNCSMSPWFTDNFNRCWGFGNIKPGGISSRFAEKRYGPEVMGQVAKLAPHLFRLYHTPPEATGSRPY